MPRINRQRILVACQPVKIATNKTGVPLHNSKIGNSRSNPIKKPPLKVRLCTSHVVVQQVRPPGPPIFGRLPSRYSNRVRPLLPVRRTNRKNRINQYNLPLFWGSVSRPKTSHHRVHHADEQFGERDKTR